MEGKTVLSNEALFLPNMNMSLSGLLPVDEKFLLTNVTMNHNDPILAVVRFMCETVLTLMVSLLGLAGNTISLGVLYRMKKRKLCSVATLLQVSFFFVILITTSQRMDCFPDSCCCWYPHSHQQLRSQTVQIHSHEYRLHQPPCIHVSSLVRFHLHLEFYQHLADRYPFLESLPGGLQPPGSVHPP